MYQKILLGHRTGLSKNQISYWSDSTCEITIVKNIYDYLRETISDEALRRFPESAKEELKKCNQ